MKRIALASSILITLLASQPATAQAPPAAANAVQLPWCGKRIPDKCQQTPAQEARAFSAAQAEARDARFGGQWSPNHFRIRQRR